jgi:sugar O-acyltransferase (sialic acid O-acetyltransferase NeuD family)
VIEILRLTAGYEVTGLLDPNPALQGKTVLGIPVLGDDRLLHGLVARGMRHFFVGVGSTGDAALRRRLFEAALDQGMTPVTAIHPGSFLSPSIQLGAGVIIMAAAVINCGAIIGSNVIVNSGAIVEHDCIIGDHAHIASGACLASAVRVGDGAHIGTGATIRQCITIGAQAVVGAGAAVVDNVPPGAIVTGVPARPQNRKETPADARQHR